MEATKRTGEVKTISFAARNPFQSSEFHLTSNDSSRRSSGDDDDEAPSITKKMRLLSARICLDRAIRGIRAIGEIREIRERSEMMNRDQRFQFAASTNELCAAPKTCKTCKNWKTCKNCNTSKTCETCNHRVHLLQREAERVRNGPSFNSFSPR